MQTGRNKVFGGFDRAAAASLSLGRKWSRKRAANSDIQRYRIRDRYEYLLWTEDAGDITELPEAAQAYLREHRKELKKRAAYKRGNCDWWKFTWPLHKEFYAQDKIISPFLSTQNRFALDTSREFIGLTDTVVLFKSEGIPEDIAYFLALLNSKLLDFRFKGIAKLKGNGIYEYFWNSVSKLPIARLDLTDSSQKVRHGQIVQMSKRMISLTRDLHNARSDAERGPVENLLDATDKRLNELVYEVYGIPEHLRSTIENGTTSKQRTRKKARKAQNKTRAAQRETRASSPKSTQSTLFNGN
jgi:hypothetical protein